MKYVAIVKGKDRYRSVRNALADLHMKITPNIPKDLVVIKPNFVDVRFPLACTDPFAVKAVVDHLAELGVNNIAIAEEASVGTTHEAFKVFGYYDVFRSYSWVDLVALENLSQDVNPSIYIELFKWDRSIQKIPLHGYLVNAPYLISVNPPKTHDTVIVTLALKNIAMALPKGRNKGRVHQGYGIININIAILALKRMADMAVIDGTRGMEGNGPLLGDPKDWEVVFASHNIVEMDSAIAYAMGFAPTDIGYLYALYKLRGYDIFFRDVEFLGESIESVKTVFKPHREYNLMKKWLDSAYQQLLNQLATK